MSKYSLSKSSFIKGLQCEKYLYLYKNNYELKDPIKDSSQAVLIREIKLDYYTSLFQVV